MIRPEYLQSDIPRYVLGVSNAHGLLHEGIFEGDGGSEEG